VALFAIVGVWQVFAVSSITVKGNKTISSDEVIKLVNQSFGHHAFSSNLLTLSLADLPQDLPTESNQRIKSAVITRAWPNRIVVTITERTAALGWRSGSGVYALDSDGQIIGLFSDLKANVPIVIDTSNLPVQIGDTVAPTQFVTFCTQVAAALPKLGIGVTGFTIADTTSEVYVATNKGYQLKFDTTREVGEELGDLKGVLTTLASQHKTASQYIDLRIAGKAYYL
jgi:cell division septal protein FtsQ